MRHFAKLHGRKHTFATYHQVLMVNGFCSEREFDHTDAKITICSGVLKNLLEFHRRFSESCGIFSFEKLTRRYLSVPSGDSQLSWRAAARAGSFIAHRVEKEEKREKRVPALARAPTIPSERPALRGAVHLVSTFMSTGRGLDIADSI